MSRSQINHPAILSTAYLPNIQYVSKLFSHTQSFIDIHENYQKQSFRNRCQIYGANGVMDLSIPVIKKNGNKTKTKDIEIENHTNWMQVHWRAIISAYNSSPFFEIFEEELVHIYEEKEKFLIDFNEKALDQIISSLGMQIKTNFTEKFITPLDQKFDFRHSIHPKKRMQKPDSFFNNSEYNQVFSAKYGFQSNLSFIDLLFNEGPQSIPICLK